MHDSMKHGMHNLNFNTSYLIFILQGQGLELLPYYTKRKELTIIPSSTSKCMHNEYMYVEPLYVYLWIRLGVDERIGVSMTGKVGIVV